MIIPRVNSANGNDLGNIKRGEMNNANLRIPRINSALERYNKRHVENDAYDCERPIESAIEPMVRYINKKKHLSINFTKHDIQGRNNSNCICQKQSPCHLIISL